MGGLPMGDTTVSAKKKMDEKTRKLMEGICPFNVNATINYTPKIMERLPAEYRPVFTLRPLKVSEIKSFRASLSLIDSKKSEDETEIKNCVRLCVVNIKNYYDAGTGELIEYKQAPDGGMDKDLFDTIPIPVISDLIMYVAKISGLADVEKTSL